MSRRGRALLLAVLAVPALTGWPLGLVSGAPVAGAGWAWLGYGAAVHAVLRAILGGALYGAGLALAALAAVPVVYGGAAVSCLLWALGASAVAPAQYSPHYLALCLTMLTVIPLALALVSLVPLLELENRLLRQERGVTALERRLLIALRVFNHIVFNVLPAILEVLREEGHLLTATVDAGRPSEAERRQGLGQRWRALVAGGTHVALEAICAAVRHLPLWAVEIAQLPVRDHRDREKR
jgi:hypothetical protein